MRYSGEITTRIGLANSWLIASLLGYLFGGVLLALAISGASWEGGFAAVFLGICATHLLQGLVMHLFRPAISVGRWFRAGLSGFLGGIVAMCVGGALILLLVAGDKPGDYRSFTDTLIAIWIVTITSLAIYFGTWGVAAYRQGLLLQRDAGIAVAGRRAWFGANMGAQAIVGAIVAGAYFTHVGGALLVLIWSVVVSAGAGAIVGLIVGRALERIMSGGALPAE